MGWDREILLTRVTLVTVSIEKQKEMRLGKKARSREKLEFLNHLDFKDSKEERYKFLLAPQISPLVVRSGLRSSASTSPCPCTCCSPSPGCSSLPSPLTKRLLIMSSSPVLRRLLRSVMSPFWAWWFCYSIWSHLVVISPISNTSSKEAKAMPTLSLYLWPQPKA